MSKQPVTYVLFKKGETGARLYVNPKPGAEEELAKHGTLLKNPDLSKVRDVGPKDWRLKGGKVRPKFKKPFKLSLNVINFILLIVILLMKLREWELV
jgi:hypothetical protein